MIESMAALSSEDVFARNRALGRLSLSVAADGDRSRRQRVHEAGSLRVRFPNTDRSGPLDAVIVNTAGGVTGGDRFDIDVDIKANARLSITTAAAEKVYRSLGDATEIRVKLNVAAGGQLAWLPQETILFNQLNLRRTIEVELARRARLLLLECVVFGRSAMGESVVEGHFRDRWRVRVDGALVYAENIRLEGAVAQKLAQRATAGGGAAIATVLKIPADEAAVADILAMQDKFAGEVGISARNGLAVARLVARDGAALRRDLAHILPVLGVPLPRLWLN